MSHDNEFTNYDTLIPLMQDIQKRYSAHVGGSGEYGRPAPLSPPPALPLDTSKGSSGSSGRHASLSSSRGSGEASARSSHRTGTVPVLSIIFIYINPHQLVQSADAADRASDQCFGYGFIESGSGFSILD
jgi:hypothetical protein